MPIPTPKEVPPIPINEPEPVANRIAWHLEKTLVRFLLRIFNLIVNPIRNMLSYALEQWIDSMEETGFVRTSEIRSILLNDPSAPDFVKNIVRGIETNRGQGDFLMIVSFGIISIVAHVMTVLNPYMELGRQYWNRQVKPSVSPVGETIEAYVKGQVSDSWLNDVLERNGYTRAEVEPLIRKSQAGLPVTEIISLLLRGDIDEETARNRIKFLGVRDGDIDDILKLRWIIPGPSDLIRMAVRDAWNDDAVKTFGYDDDFPSEFAEWASKQGLSPEWAKRYWRAHWELPGVNQGFEMLHRGIITRKQLELLLRIKDIPSFWRNGLINLSFNPYTRVDIRRMFEKGFVTEEEVYLNYLDLGYDEDKATKLTLWTIEEYGTDYRNISKSTISRSYTNGIITKKEAEQYLNDIGLNPIEVELIITDLDLRIQEEYEKELVENVRLQFVSREIEEPRVFEVLNKLNPPSGFIENKLSIWRIQRDREVRKLTRAEIEKFFKSGIYDDAQVFNEMRRIGYTKEHTQDFIKLWTGE